MSFAVESQAGRDHRVQRDRLFARLDRRGIHRVNLVCAPAGFGKTTTVRQWLEHRGEPTFWVDLSPDDNDPFRLWSRIIDESIRQTGRGIRARVALRSMAGSVRPAIERLAEDLAADGAPICLVLDDFHLIEDRDCVRTIELAIEQFSSQGRLVLISRSVPKLPLQRYEGRGQLLRVGASDLAFDEAETLSLLADKQEIQIGPEVAGELCERTGGWPGVLYLSALWLQDNPDLIDISQLIPQRQERIADFLMTEVIGGLEPAVREFLQWTSFLGWMSGELCDEVCGFSGSAEMLDEVCRANQLVERDRMRPGWFRYHALMRDLLLEQLVRRAPETLPGMRRSAIDWFRRHDMIDAAAEMAIEAGEYGTLADLIEANHIALVSAGRLATIWRWGRELPKDILEQRPGMTLVIALAAELQAVPVVRIRRLLASVERSREGTGADWTSYHEAFWQSLRASTAGKGVGASIEAARLTVAAVEEIPEHQLVGKAFLASHLEMAGELEEAEQLAREVVEDPDAEARPHGLIFATVALALVENSKGQVQAAEGWVRAGHEAVRKFGLQESRVDSMACLADAHVALSAGDLARAGRAAEKALLVEFEDPPMKARMLLVAAEVRSLRGQIEQAEAALGMADEIVEACPDIGQALALRERVRARIGVVGSAGTYSGEPLSKAELRILPLLEHGSSRAAIAEELFLSVNTVKTHMRSIYRKLGAGSREDAVARARMAGLL
ncbi:MAG TPA: LuxR C-terminal-related transcriptional regulator [Solirubrobacterales bacterium]|nr:LuxR C-terminal-related transcriptional regulator [Solirubrobacterales bacterium]